MSPEDRMRRDPLPVDDVVVPFEDDRLDPELAAIDAELRRASDRMHRAHARDGRERPSGSFAGSLRARLLAEAAQPLPAAPSASPAARAGDAPHDAPHAASYARTPGHVNPRVARRTPTILPAPRWSVLAVAAVFLASVIGLNADRLFGAPAPSRVTAAAAATIERDGAVTPLAPGTELRAGDTVRAAVRGGAASLALGGSILRLEAGAAVRLDTLTATIAVEQLDGRAWHRVDVPDGGAYRVTTGDLAWTAVGTAFDLERSGTRARLLTVEHDVLLTGPGVSLRIPEGRDAVVDTAGGDPDVSVNGVDAAAPGDPWLVANARLDHAAGFGTGWLTTAALDASAVPSPSPSAAPSAAPGSPEPSTEAPPTIPTTPSVAPTVTPGPTPSATAKATPRPTMTAKPTATPKATPKPTPAPTAKPTPVPTATPTPGLLALSLAPTSCNGAALLTWSGYPGDTFHHWTILRAPEPFEVPAAYPPPAGITALGASYSKNPSVSSFADATLAPGATAYYRVVAWDASDRSIAASPAKALTGKPVASLGTFGAAAAPGGVDASWGAYGGPGACFTYYKITWSASNPNPSYVGEHDGALPVGDQGATSQYVALPVGTWWIRVEAILATDVGKHVVGKSSVAQVTVGP
jgi:outer membrane biosynthesis protein TonB